MSDVVLDKELQVAGHNYRVGRMSVFDQMNVASDFRDILMGLAMIKRERPKTMDDTEYNKAVQFIIVSRANIPPEVRERVMNTCLRQVTRQSSGWSRILADDGVLQFVDIQLPQLVTLLHATFEHNRLIDFFSESPSNLGGQGTRDSGQGSQEQKSG